MCPGAGHSLRNVRGIVRRKELFDASQFCECIDTMCAQRSKKLFLIVLEQHELVNCIKLKMGNAEDVRSAGATLRLRLDRGLQRGLPIIWKQPNVTLKCDRRINEEGGRIFHKRIDSRHDFQQ